MSIFSVAVAALAFWSRSDAIIAVAIAGAESSYGANPDGDPWYAFGVFSAVYHDWACGDYTSFGDWQINLRWNHAIVASLSGATSPCDLAAWLKASDDNNARAARAVYASQGWTAWAAYNSGDYQDHLTEARGVVEFLAPGFGAPGPIHPVDPPPVAVEPPVAYVAPPAASVAPP